MSELPDFQGLFLYPRGSHGLSAQTAWTMMSKGPKSLPKLSTNLGEQYFMKYCRGGLFCHLSTDIKNIPNVSNLLKMALKRQNYWQLWQYRLFRNFHITSSFLSHQFSSYSLVCLTGESPVDAAKERKHWEVENLLRMSPTGCVIIKVVSMHSLLHLYKIILKLLQRLQNI